MSCESVCPNHRPTGQRDIYLLKTHGRMRVCEFIESVVPLVRWPQNLHIDSVCSRLEVRVVGNDMIDKIYRFR